MRVHPALGRALRPFALILVALALGGCASMVGPNPRDPLEPFNRKMAEFNENVDSIVLKPVATAYRNGVPPATVSVADRIAASPTVFRETSREGESTLKYVIAAA